MNFKLPTSCPACGSGLEVKNLACRNCHTEVTGHFTLPLFCRLTAEEQEFILAFVCNSGSLKEMAKWKGLSYPTVRNMLDDLIKKIKDQEKNIV